MTKEQKQFKPLEVRKNRLYTSSVGVVPLNVTLLSLHIDVTLIHTTILSMFSTISVKSLMWENGMGFLWKGRASASASASGLATTSTLVLTAGISSLTRLDGWNLFYYVHDCEILPFQSPTEVVCQMIPYAVTFCIILCHNNSNLKNKYHSPKIFINMILTGVLKCSKSRINKYL